VTEPIAEEPAAWLAGRARVVNAAPGEAAFEEAIGEAAALVVRTYTMVDAALLARGPALRAVGRAGVGLDNIDREACRARGIAVFNAPDANTTAVAEYVFALMLHHVRPLTPVTGPMELAAWERARRPGPGTRELGASTVGIIGFGRIGSRVGRVARAFGARVLFHDLLDIAETHGCEPAPPERVLAEADIVTLHVDGRPANRGLIDARRLALLRPDCLLINTSRGPVIDEAALAAWLAAHPAGAALLDVHAVEPIAAGHPLLGLPNATLYPHAAASTPAARTRMGWVVRAVWEHIRPGESA
jgi:phosphoglycerate dehydrogenase-like enzyme